MASPAARLVGWQEAEGLDRGTRLVDEQTLPEKILLAVRVIFFVLLEYTKIAPDICREVYRYIIKPPLKDISGKTVLVTGAGNGLGRLLSLRLAKEGARVICVDIDEKAAEKTAGEINVQYGSGRSKAYSTDVSSVEEVQNLKNNVSKDFGNVDILVNNAGLIPLLGLFEGSDVDIQRTIGVNLMSQFWMARAFVPEMQARGGGHVVSVSSICSIYYGSYPRMTAYVASKCAVTGLTASITSEAPKVKTTIVMPMTIATRKSIVDHVECILPPLIPEQVAEATIDALLREYELITIPGHMFPLISFYGMFPSIFRKPWEKVLGPNIQ